MEKRYLDLNTYFQCVFGERVHKISLDAGLSCPNRDGTLSGSGCIYCNEKGSGTAAFQKGLSIKEQILKSRAYIRKRYKARKFIAYFQSYTNTYGPLDLLSALYEEALSQEGVVGLAIGTRPDCVDESILDMIAGYKKDGMIWMEYGVQTVHNHTLVRINRGHDFSASERALKMSRDRGLLTCAHVILGLPGETREDMQITASTLAGLGINGVKLHLLYVIQNTALEKMYLSGRYTPLDMDAYAELVADIIERMPKDVVIQRLTSDPHLRELVAPKWAMDKKATMARIHRELQERDTFQGAAFSG